MGLSAFVEQQQSGNWSLILGTKRLAQWVAIEAKGCIPGDNWFHLVPGQTRKIDLMYSANPVPNPVRADPRSEPGSQRERSAPFGSVRALNSDVRARF